ncbi:MAG: DUF502 domain-containing protein [Candidatus Omnitrophota bacterium]
MTRNDGRTFGVQLRKYLFSGLAAILPLFITVYIVVLIFEISNRFAGRYINAFLMDRYGFSVPGLGLLLLLIFVIAVGVFVRNFIGNKIFSLAEKFFYRVPIVANIYPSAKKLSDFLFEDEKQKFRKVVLVEYPAPGSYSIGFITNEGIEEFNRKTKSELVTVLVPLSPMPYSGLLLILPKEKLIEVDMTVNQAVKLVLSGGVVFPELEQEKG